LYFTTVESVHRSWAAALAPCPPSLFSSVIEAQFLPPSFPPSEKDTGFRFPACSASSAGLCENPSSQGRERESALQRGQKGAAAGTPLPKRSRATCKEEGNRDIHRWTVVCLLWLQRQGGGCCRCLLSKFGRLQALLPPVPGYLCVDGKGAPHGVRNKVKASAADLLNYGFPRGQHQEEETMGKRGGRG
jgi:hypothetical protein